MVTVKRCGYWTLFVVTCCISSAIASDILVVCPTASYSHQQPFLIISQALLQRNHTVTLLTCNPEVTNNNGKKWWMCHQHWEKSVDVQFTHFFIHSKIRIIDTEYETKRKEPQFLSDIFIEGERN
ncbi:uncharacterized protein LOC108253753 isoform X3 [Diaphorina citri]|uniref:Uncharacterized protein LOC108253753 isoform X1 n=1 Tax=Diaphorina citri TaxID=121845 RepID=A0A1S4ENT1_DIACI|nr:uncharacterized protein LOC108253753 isoform X2 [Diaphorina citri]XP_017303820.1 uncharacterized protein LOC108253753 isoform X4 [Diaphorina citri]XP_026686965.1 uncharacterized protein LOC108253753 isoform X1 [Diaphorina citri]XP_026686966.1 uncharacterized protein LOC108253753 isoform X3 [Diaphorina citri]